MIRINYKITSLKPLCALCLDFVDFCCRRIRGSILNCFITTGLNQWLHALAATRGRNTKPRMRQQHVPHA